MKIFIATDHAGFVLKEELKQRLASNYQMADLGAANFVPTDDFPIYAKALCKKITENLGSRGILICGSGSGMCVVANKHTGIRASVCHDLFSAKQSVEHNDVNVLCLGAILLPPYLAEKIIIEFIEAKVDQTSKYQKRRKMIEELENSVG